MKLTQQQEEKAAKIAELRARIEARRAANGGIAPALVGDDDAPPATVSADDATRAALNLAGLASLAENLETPLEVLRDIGADLRQQDFQPLEDLLDTGAQFDF